MRAKETVSAIESILVEAMNAQFAESEKLEQAIQANLRGLGYGG